VVEEMGVLLLSEVAEELESTLLVDGIEERELVVSVTEALERVVDDSVKTDVDVLDIVD
jgi:hypothetical protein